MTEAAKTEDRSVALASHDAAGQEQEAAGQEQEAAGKEQGVTDKERDAAGQEREAAGQEQDAAGKGRRPRARLLDGPRPFGLNRLPPLAGWSRRPLLRWTCCCAAAVAAVVLPFLLGRAFGPALRGAAMVTTATSPAASVVAFDDASRTAAAFMAGRDTATVRVRWPTTARELLRLYHLENNLSARAALLEQLGVADLETVLPEGSSFSFVLSPERLEP